MSYAKGSVTLDAKVAAELRAIAGHRGVSAFVNEAVRRQLQARRVQRLLDEMTDEYGSADEDVVRDVEAIAWPGQARAADS
jgi:Arc/MetJ family transcription regulator